MFRCLQAAEAVQLRPALLALLQRMGASKGPPPDTHTPASVLNETARGAGEDESMDQPPTPGGSATPTPRSPAASSPHPGHSGSGFTEYWTPRVGPALHS